MHRATWLVILLVAAGCGKKKERPFSCYVHVNGGPNGAVVFLDDLEMGPIVDAQKKDAGYGFGRVNCGGKAEGLTQDEARKKFFSAKAKLVLSTPCGPKEIALENNSKGRIDVAVPEAARSSLPRGIRVYSDADITSVKIGSATLRHTTDHVEVPEGLGGHHVAWLFDMTCAANLPVEVGGKPSGELDTQPLADPPPLGNSVFVPSDPARCYEHDTVGYGEVEAGGKADKLQGSASYVLKNDKLDYLMKDPPGSVAARQGDKMKFRTYVKACP